jgi:hypothetical protein
MIFFDNFPDYFIQSTSLSRNQVGHFGPHGTFHSLLVSIKAITRFLLYTGDRIGIADYGYIEGKITISNVTVDHNDIQLNDTIWGAIVGEGV